MIGPQHYEEAEKLIDMAEGQDLAQAMFTLAQAQTHATLALAAATALGQLTSPRAVDINAWEDVAGKWTS